MERDIVDIVNDKNFNELTAQERAELNDFCSSEEEFLQLKSVFAAVDGMQAEELVPRAETKEKLDKLFYETHPGAAPIWYNSFLAVAIPREKPIYRQPLLQIAAVVAVILLAIPLFENDLTTDSNLMAETNVPEQSSGANEEKNADVVEEDAVTNQLDQEVVVANTTQAGIGNATAPGSTTGTREIVFTSTISGVDDRLSLSAGDHPDGIFDTGSESFSISASETPDVLDLLISTF